MLLGVAINLKGKEGTLYVEYHKCDECDAEYRLYFKNAGTVEEAFQAIARMLGNKPQQQDLCFNCQNHVIGEQVMLPLGV